MIDLRNQNITLRVNPLGAQMEALAVYGKPLLWEKDPAVWNGTAPVLFPICGRLAEGRYLLDGASYELPIHGFARNMLFTVAKRTETEAVFSLSDSAETRAVYPFAFRFDIAFSLLENGVEIAYTVHNPGARPLPFATGGHYGFTAPGGVDRYKIVFDRPLSLAREVLAAGLLTGGREPVPCEGDTLYMDYSMCDNDSYVFVGQDSRACALMPRKGAGKILLEYPDTPHLLLWTQPGAEYLCIEPWTGCPDGQTPTDLYKKKEMRLVPPGGTKRVIHRIKGEI